MLEGKRGKVTKCEIRKCLFYSFYESSNIFKMLCKNLEEPDFISGSGTGFVLKGRLIISLISQYSQTEIEKKTNGLHM